VIAVATEGDEEIKESVDHVLYVPHAPELLLPILEVVPLQLLAYHIAVLRGCDVDQAAQSGQVRYRGIGKAATSLSQIRLVKVNLVSISEGSLF